jgi:hypothetical protein
MGSWGRVRWNHSIWMQPKLFCVKHITQIVIFLTLTKMQEPLRSYQQDGA